jgi:hypothetical protein
MPDKLDEIPVLAGHLMEIREVLSAAHNYHVAEDLQVGYRSLGQGPQRQSQLTRSLGVCFERLNDYLMDEEEDENNA